MIAALSQTWGETIVPCGGAAANCLRLTTQNPVRTVYLTSGPNRRLRFGKSIVELRHAPRWQLAAPHRRAGDVIRALAWLGPEEVEDGLEVVLPTLSETDRDELAARPDRHAHLDGGAGEHPPCTCLKRDSRISRPTTGVTLSK